MRASLMIVLAFVIVAALAAPAFAVEMGDLTGRDFGQHHSMHARANGFDGDHNPGALHRGFAGWAGHHASHAL